jgi:hypothetical protein
MMLNRVMAVICATILAIAGLAFAGYLLTHGQDQGTVTIILISALTPTVTALLALAKASDAQNSITQFAAMHDQLHTEQVRILDKATDNPPAAA